jgi:hypothetical protein
LDVSQAPSSPVPASTKRLLGRRFNILDTNAKVKHNSMNQSKVSSLLFACQ